MEERCIVQQMALESLGKHLGKEMKLHPCITPYILWFELRPSKRYVEVLTLVPMNVTLFGNRVLVDVIK